MVIDPYSTSYGSLLNVERTKSELIRYIMSTNLSNLNYEVCNTTQVRVVFITGNNDDERSLPPFDHPIVVKVRNQDVVVGDLRKFMRKHDEQPVNLLDNCTNSTSMLFTVNRCIIMRDMLNSDSTMYRRFKKHILSAFSMFISHCINGIVSTNPEEKTIIQVVAATYANLLFETDVYESLKNSEAVTAIIANSKIAVGLKAKEIEEIVISSHNHFTNYLNDNKLQDVNISTLMYGISKYLEGSGKDKLVNTTILMNTIGNMWYGVGNGDTLVMALESIPTLITLIYHTQADSVYKKCRLADILFKVGSLTGSKEFLQSFPTFIKERQCLEN